MGYKFRFMSRASAVIPVGVFDALHVFRDNARGFGTRRFAPPHPPSHRGFRSARADRMTGDIEKARAMHLKIEQSGHFALNVPACLPIARVSGIGFQRVPFLEVLNESGCISLSRIENLRRNQEKRAGRAGEVRSRLIERHTRAR